MRIIGDTNIPFLKYRAVALTLSAIVILAGIVYELFGPGLNLGIDFRGGTQVTVKFRAEQDLGRLREAIMRLDVGEPVVQRFDEAEKHEVLIRVQNPGDEEGDFTSPILDVLAEEVAVHIQLVAIGDIGAVVDAVGDAIAIGVGLVRIGVERTVVDAVGVLVVELEIDQHVPERPLRRVLSAPLDRHRAAALAAVDQAGHVEQVRAPVGDDALAVVEDPHPTGSIGSRSSTNRRP